MPTNQTRLISNLLEVNKPPCIIVNNQTLRKFNQENNYTSGQVNLFGDKQSIVNYFTFLVNP